MIDIVKTYFNEIRHCKGLDKHSTNELAVLAQQGDEESKKILVKNHLLLVAKIARQYINLGVEFSDLLAEGNMGLLTAVQKWNPTKGASFTTCASWWIKQSIIRNCMHGNRLVRLPEHISELMRTGRIDFTYGEIDIDKPNEDGSTLAESLPDKEVDIFASEKDMLTKRLVSRIMATLKPKEARVIELHYGLNGEEKRDVKEIAELLSLTTTRINQILRTSLEKMKESSRN
jgi:RNA polymerase sigma factor (sigma-70 family)